MDSNRAQAILDSVSDSTLSRNEISKDNLSAVVLQNITFGHGQTVATCICDGNHAADLDRVHHGSLASQAMIEVFEQEMKQLRAKTATSPDTRHRDGVANNNDHTLRR
jgi:hypothetical protein